jgi:hypothetical protein
MVPRSARLEVRSHPPCNVIAASEYVRSLRQRGVSTTGVTSSGTVGLDHEGLYVGLERGDVSRWPMGIYRRSFFREYALALGLPVDAALSEFLQLFPEEGEQRVSPALTMPAGPLRMTFADRTWLHTSRVQVLAASVDLVMVVAITVAVAWWMPIAAGTVAAVVALIYYSLASACLACSPGTWWLRTRGNRKRAKALRLAR